MADGRHAATGTSKARALADRSVAGAGGVASPVGRGADATVVPARARGLAWRGVVEATLLAMLRGFSRVTRCSTEGRALMSMDLQV